MSAECQTQRRKWVAIIVSVTLIVFDASQSLGAEGPSFVPPDCGTNCLYFLLTMNGANVNLADLQAKLPPPRNDGYSMLELSQAIETSGLYPRGYELNSDSSPPQRATICYFADNKRNGHYVVIRGVGVSGRKVQVFDPPNRPFVTDFSRFATDAHWTGRALTCESWSEHFTRKLTPYALVAFASAGLVWLIRANRKYGASIRRDQVTA